MNQASWVCSLTFLQLNRRLSDSGAHHLDLRASTKDDLNWLVEQRQFEVDTIKDWLENYYQTKQSVSMHRQQLSIQSAQDVTATGLLWAKCKRDLLFSPRGFLNNSAYYKSLTKNYKVPYCCIKMLKIHSVFLFCMRSLIFCMIIISNQPFVK